MTKRPAGKKKALPKKRAARKKAGANPAEEASRRVRLREIEQLMLNGYKAQEIFDILGNARGVTYGTIRNDISAIYAARREEIAEVTELEGRGGYLARLQAVRRSAVAEKDLRLVHQLDKEIARLSGVEVDPKHRMQVSVDGAKAFMQKVMERIFLVVTDQDQQDRIQAILEDAASEDGGG